MAKRVEVSRRVAVDLQRESFILYIEGEKQLEHGYEKAADFAAALTRVLRSDEFKDWLARRLQSVKPPPTVEPDRDGPDG